MRGFWLLVAAAIGGVLVWQGRPWLEQRVAPAVEAVPRAIAPAGDLAADEKATIELFERRAPDGGIASGDIIIAIDGKPVDSVARLVNRLDEHKIGDTVKLTVQRDGKPTELTAALKGGA
jgi:hypothetical protein